MSNKVIGSICLIAGTTIGASMLALPLTSARIGFANSVVLLVVMWALMLSAAIVMVEVSHGKGVSIATLAGEKLGLFAKNLAAGTLIVLFWALLAAYISGASSIVHQLCGLPQWILSLLYVFLLGFLILCKTKAVDYMNRVFFALKILVFILISICLLPYVQLHTLLQTPVSEPFLADAAAHHAIPIFFAAYGFHGSIPSLINYLEGDRRKIYLSLFVGSLIPLVIYILWQTMTLGVVSGSFGGDGDFTAFVSVLTQYTQNPHLQLMVSAFTFLVITTSFLGVSLGFYDYTQELFFKKNKSTRVSPVLFTFLVPLLFSLFYPRGFVFALGFASMALSLYAVIFPCCVAYCEVNNKSIFVNKILLTILLLFGLSIIVIEMLSN